MASASQDDCDSASASSLIICTLRAGARCVFENETADPYTCTTGRGIGTGTATGITRCVNSTIAELCQPGYYCLQGESHTCLSGYYCPIGTAHPATCPFGVLTCPHSLTELPSQGALFGLLLVVFLAIVVAYWTLGMKLIRSESSKKWETVARVVSQRRYDPVNRVMLEHNQHAMVSSAENITVAKSARERTVSSARWSKVFDTSGTAAVVSRFSVDMGKEGAVSPGSGEPQPTSVAFREFCPLPVTPELAVKSPASPTGRRQRGKLARAEASLLRVMEAKMPQYDLEEVQVPLTVAFLHMSLDLKVSGVRVLSDICVTIRPFHVTAVMGPSGAGKTSLLSLLRGEAHYAVVTGSTTVNGHDIVSLESLRRRVAYVPQEDIVGDLLSAEENILYSAILFNRRGYLTAAECMPMVLRAEKMLGICHVRTAVVGSPAQRGISGGQRKRVSIAMELMKEAELFFLDEPTSGLDSASSMLVMSALHCLASKGVTVCTTIHQPRQEILVLMDSLVLLAPGGRVAYFGPIVDLRAHFSALQFTCPPTTNIADFVMDTLCGYVPLDGACDVQDVQETIDCICDWWSQHKYPVLEWTAGANASTLRQLSSVEDLAAIPISITPEQEWRYSPLMCTGRVYWACFNRQARTNYREFRSVATICFLLMVFGLIVAFLIGPMALDGTAASISTFSAQVTSGTLVFALLVQAASLRLFTADQLLRDREFCAGAAIAPYFLGKLLGNYCEVCFYAFAFLVGYYPFLEARAPFVVYWGVFVLLHLAVAGLVNLIAIAYPGTNKGTFAVGCVVLLWAFGGLSPPLNEMQQSMSHFATILNYASPFKYAYAAEVIGELSQYPDVWDVEAIYHKLGYKASDRSEGLAGLVVYCIVTNLLACACAKVGQAWPKHQQAVQGGLHWASYGYLFGRSSGHLSLEMSTTEGSACSPDSEFLKQAEEDDFLHAGVGTEERECDSDQETKCDGSEGVRSTAWDLEGQIEPADVPPPPAAGVEVRRGSYTTLQVMEVGIV